MHYDERLYLPREGRRRLKALGSRYRAQLEDIIEHGKTEGVVRDSVDSHFTAQSVIGMCNGLGELIVRDPDLDVFALARKTTDLLLHGTGPEPTQGD